MQGGQIVNQISNHIRDIMLGLRTEYVRVPDYLVQILDSYARYKNGGPAGRGIAIPSLLNRSNAIFYNGLDEAESVEDNNEVEQHFAYWKHLYVPVALQGTVLKQTTGITTTQLIQQNMSLGHMNEDDMLMLLNLFETSYTTAAAGIQAKKVHAAHGHMLQLSPDEAGGRKPETLDDLFNEDGYFHGIGPADLGSWDKGHTWGNDPFSNTGTDEEKKYRHRPQIYDMGSNRPSIATLDPILRRLNMVVQTPKLGVMWADGFSELVGDVRGKNLNVPMLLAGGAGWEFDMDCVKIAGTTIIADPNTPENKFRILNVGTPSLEDGTIFPFYYDALMNPIDAFAMKADMLSMNKDRPKGLDFGRPRQTPYNGSEWDRSSTHVDAVISRIFLDYIPFVVTIRSYQTELRFT